VGEEESAKIEDVTVAWIHHLDATNFNMAWVVKANAHPVVLDIRSREPEEDVTLHLDRAFRGDI
jgi:hypothetical protein